MCVRVEKYPSYAAPARKTELISISGRNGDIIMAQDAFESYTQEYEVYISAEQRLLPRVARMVADWIYAPKGFAKLEDTYDLDTFRMAAYTGNLDIENVMNRFGRVRLEFLCQPQRWYKTGQYPVQIESGTILKNPSAFVAQPLITVTGNGAGQLIVGDRTVDILSLNGEMVLDCETQNATINGENANMNIRAVEFPVLGQSSTVTWSGDITSVEIVPRWWTV